MNVNKIRYAAFEEAAAIARSQKSAPIGGSPDYDMDDHANNRAEDIADLLEAKAKERLGGR